MRKIAKNLFCNAHFESELGAHFKSELGGQYYRNSQCSLEIFKRIINMKVF